MATFEIVETSIERGQDTVDADGIAEVEIGSPPLGHQWFIERATIRLSKGSARTMTIYVGDINDANIAEQTKEATFNVLDCSQPILVTQDLPVTFRWDDAEEDAIATVRAQVRLERIVYEEA